MAARELEAPPPPRLIDRLATLAALASRAETSLEVEDVERLQRAWTALLAERRDDDSPAFWATVNYERGLSFLLGAPGPMALVAASTSFEQALEFATDQSAIRLEITAALGRTLLLRALQGADKEALQRALVVCHESAFAPTGTATTAAVELLLVLSWIPHLAPDLAIASSGSVRDFTQTGILTAERVRPQLSAVTGRVPETYWVAVMRLSARSVLARGAGDVNSSQEIANGLAAASMLADRASGHRFRKDVPLGLMAAGALSTMLLIEVTALIDDPVQRVHWIERIAPTKGRKGAYSLDALKYSLSAAADAARVVGDRVATDLGVSAPGPSPVGRLTGELVAALNELGDGSSVQGLADAVWQDVTAAASEVRLWLR